MLKFQETKESCQKVGSFRIRRKSGIEDSNQETIQHGVFQSKISVSIEGMRSRPVQNNGEFNGEVTPYQAKFSVKNNRIFAVTDLTIYNSANTGLNPVNEYQSGEEHKGEIQVVGNEVTLTVQNPGGTLNLMINYSLITERPIERQDVVTENADYKVAQDYLDRKEDADEVIIITDDEKRAVSTWFQNTHANNHINDIMLSTAAADNVSHDSESNIDGGNLHAKKRVTKKGQSPSSIVLDMVNMIFKKIEIKEVSAEKTYIIVHLGARNFILTLSDSETVSDLKNRIRDMAGIEIANLDGVVQNLATGKQLRDSMLCKEIQNGQKKTNHFVAPQTNIKWISIET